ncbi:hypothetical protein [Xenorhabdus innexi]|uniref:Uncharacterized protein n=1 Tax=Xenorhabdus innexi TaxID=290109 RepID=A0A1N6MR91_9GAMM|nr:hypothetical protein [Xenorhabdus innexi]SIP71361.1 conserved hypothetical protein [Xenorhabdus innexi]
MPKHGSKLVGLISAPRTIEGFSQYPNIKPEIRNRINDMVATANDGTHRYFLAYRSLIINAINISKSNKIANTEVIAWKTYESDPPGSNFIKLFSLQGQDFYKLSDSYLK